MNLKFVGNLRILKQWVINTITQQTVLIEDESACIKLNRDKGTYNCRIIDGSSDRMVCRVVPSQGELQQPFYSYIGLSRR